MKIVSTATMRELDRRTINDFQTPGEILMDRAGYGLALFIDHLVEDRDFSNRAVLMIAGRGNNGGDIFAAASYLHSMQYSLDILLAGSFRDVKGDALTHLGKLQAKHIKIEELPTPQDWEHAIAHMRATRGPDMPVVDGVLGTGISGPARGPAAGAISLINTLGKYNPVVAVDVPSGLDSDTGLAGGDAVRADYTVTMGLPKRGLVQPAALDYVGTLEVIDIGLPRDLVDKAESDMEFIAVADLQPFFGRRPRAMHKGGCGHLLFIGGAAGYTGAAILAIRAALRSGVGLVTAVVPQGIAATVAGQVPEAMVHGAAETESGALSGEDWPKWHARLADFTALAAGPGLTCCPQTTRLAEKILTTCTLPLLLDADALNVFANRLAALGQYGGDLVITPHPGEMGRLLGCSTDKVQADRFAAAQEAARRSNAVVALKGAGTLVAETGRPLHINMNGNPGMATGGTGDVLTGLLGGLLAQQIKPFYATCAAVFLHGRAGNIAADRNTEIGLTAGELIHAIPEALRDLSLR